MSEPNKHAQAVARAICPIPSSADEAAIIIQLACEATAAEAVEKINEWWKQLSMCELGAFCPSARDYMKHWEQRAESAEQKVEELIEKHERDIDKRNSVLSDTEYRRNKEKLRADTAEQLVLEMREALRDVATNYDHEAGVPHDRNRCRTCIAEKALSLSAPVDGKWVPVEDVRPLLEAYKADWEREQFRRDFLAKHGDKLDNI